MKFKFLLLVLFFPLFVAAQDVTLPHWETAEEQAAIPRFKPTSTPGLRTVYTNPPPYESRTMAEWEEIQSICVTYTGFKAIVAQIIEHSKEEVEVIVICSDSTEAKFELLNNFGLNNLNNVSFLEEDFDSIWIRDYGPNTVYGNEVDSLYIVDWIYNRPWRVDDDLLPNAIAEFKGLDVYATTEVPYDLIHTGGNFTSDGLGTGFSSELILDENPFKSESEIDNIMNEFMGISRYIKMETLPYDEIHHIDMHMRLLDEETLLVGQYPTGESDGPQIEANLQYVLSNYMSAFGTPYEVVRIQMPPENNGTYPAQNGDYRTYTNSVFVNNTILVPTYQEEYDTPNLAIYEEQMPGYNVIGINCNQMIGSLGALHCITRAVGVNDPLWIVHQELDDVVDIYDDFLVHANIKHRDGIGEATLYYTTDLQVGYEAVPMELTNAVEDIWTATLPNPGFATDMHYYIEGSATSGKTQVRPLPAPEGYFKFNLAYTTGDDEVVKSPSRLDAIFPNPASSITCVPVYNREKQDAQIAVFDSFGRLVDVLFDGALDAGETKHFIMAQEYAAGTYFVQLKTNEEVISQRLVIQ